MGNIYLMAAYAFLWLIFMLYAWTLSRRQARLRHELEDLKSRAAHHPFPTRSGS